MRVLLVDDDSNVRTLVRTILSREHDVDVVAEATNNVEALEVWRRERPDVVVVDHYMPGGTGVELAARIHQCVQDQPIVLFTSDKSDEVVIAAQHAGIEICLGKDGIALLPAMLRAACGLTSDE